MRILATIREYRLLLFLWRARLVRRAGRVRVLSMGGGVALPRARLGVLYSDTLSARDVAAGPRPTGSLTARLLGGGGSAPPRISTPALSFVRPCLGPRVRSLANSRLAPRRFPIQTKGMSILLTRLFGAHHDRTTLTCNHTLSPTLSGHTPQWLG